MKVKDPIQKRVYGIELTGNIGRDCIWAGVEVTSRGGI
jgi:hypothetical protein